jgi:hypothetical protein
MYQQISDIASLVFWTNVRKKTFKVTINIVLKRQFEELWATATVSLYLKKLNLNIDPSNIESTKEWIYGMVNEYMYNLTLNEENILGTIYLDDTIECKTPDFDEFALLENLQQAYSEYEQTELPMFQKIGTLLLRTPLPSIVFTSSREIPRTFLIKDTIKALGFQVNLIFVSDDIIEFPQNSYGINYCVSGIFKIHNFNGTDSLWHTILPNSLCYEKLIPGNFNTEISETKEAKSIIQNPKFVTNANIKRTLFKLDKSDFDYESEIYKHSINYLNLLEKRDLLSIKCLYEFPDIFFKNFYSKINTVDTFKFVFEEQQPAFHSDNACPNLSSDFENYLIPEVIKSNQLELEYRNWFKQNIHLTEKKILTDLFKDIHYKKWNCLPFFVDYENSGVFEFMNLNVDDIESNIDTLLQNIKLYIEKSLIIKKIISVFGKQSYAFDKVETLKLNRLPYDKETISDVLKTFELEYKRPLINMLKEYYRIKYNSNLVFEENILIGLGFRQCKVCQELNSIRKETSAYSKENEIQELIIELQATANKLNELELTLLERLDNDEQEANEILNKAIEKSELIYRRIGDRLNALGGFNLMQAALYQVSNKYSAHSVISASWNNIGVWQY